MRIEGQSHLTNWISKHFILRLLIKIFLEEAVLIPNITPVHHKKRFKRAIPSLDFYDLNMQLWVELEIDSHIQGSNYMHISFSSTRDSTPCDLIRRSDTIGTPGSSTRPASNQMSWNMMQQIQTSLEIEVFFAFAQREQQRLFIEKYVTVSTILIW